LDWNSGSVGLSEIEPKMYQVSFEHIHFSFHYRVISAVKNITRDRKVAEENINVGVVGIHAHQNAAKLAADGNYTKARMSEVDF
jgi:hypothetical protein